MTRVFISYSHRDEPLRAELDKHFALLKRQGALDVWSDHRIPPGGEVDASISEGLESADVILLLISADFIASDYCFSIEMNRAMERHDSGDCVVVPVILRPCDWQSAPFGRLKAIPTDGRAITKWPSQDEAFEDIGLYPRPTEQPFHFRPCSDSRGRLSPLAPGTGAHINAPETSSRP